MGAKLIDLTGQKFGRLTVIKRVEDHVSKSGYKTPQWLCECSCDEHKLIKVTGKRLRSGETASCGCLQKELLTNRNKKDHENSYDLTGEYGIGYTSDGSEFWFDLDDYEKIKKICWHYDTYGYVVGYDPDKSYKAIIKLHRLVMNVTNPDIKVDHKKHPSGYKHKIDNRKLNLRIVDQSKNTMNSSLRSDNTSGRTGVSFHKRDKKWYATISVNKKVIWLGSFINFEDAAKARKEAEIKYFGEYRYDANN